jgi:DNA (cytosine-5)-methyltransferase 1
MPALTYGSLFSGVGGLDLGLDRAGFDCRWQCELDGAAAGVLLHHHPRRRVFRDVSALRQFLESLPDHECEPYRVDLVCGGSPCTNLSVAGGRAGLAGSESGLFREMVAICRLLRPRLVLWENVVGAFSSREGQDFAEVVASFTGVTPAIPADGWGLAGFARGLPGRWHVAWRVFDARYFGVAQRRRRVFLVGSVAPGDGSCVEILFEPESVRGDSAPGGEAGENITGTLGSRAKGGGGLGTDFDLDGGLIPALTAKMAKGTGGPAGDECQNLVLAETAHTLTGEGHDATGRNSPNIAGPIVGVRRLTPVECERLMGWPDGHTAFSQPLMPAPGNTWAAKAKPAKEQSDGPRYRQCGNGVVSACAEWIGPRMQQFSPR